MFTKDLAHLTESVEFNGLASLLKLLRESRGEMEIWSVARPADGNWFLVKGSFTKRELANMDLHKKEPKNREVEKKENPEVGLKKKENQAVEILKRDELQGMEHLPVKIKEKLREKISQGWTTELPFEFFKDHYTESEINTFFNDKIKIYKLKATEEFFKSLIENSARIVLKRGFCRSINLSRTDSDLTEKSKNIVNHILEKCNKKFNNKLGSYKKL
jgi:hypothetical protein